MTPQGVAFDVGAGEPVQVAPHPGEVLAWVEVPEGRPTATTRSRRAPPHAEGGNGDRRRGRMFPEVRRAVRDLPISAFPEAIEVFYIRNRQSPEEG
jgi:hypothetical protein